MAETVYLLENARRLGAVDLTAESVRVADRYDWLTVGDRVGFETCVDGCLYNAQPLGVRPMGGCGAWLGLGLLGGVLVGKKAGALATGAAVAAAVLALRQGRLDFALDWVTDAANG